VGDEWYIAAAGDLKKKFFCQFDCYMAGNLNHKIVGAFEKQGLPDVIQEEFVEAIFPPCQQFDANLCLIQFSLQFAACIENVCS